MSINITPRTISDKIFSKKNREMNMETEVEGTSEFIHYGWTIASKIYK